MPARIGMPSSVPRTTASSVPDAGSRSVIRASPSAPAPNGTISAAIARAAGVLITDAVRILPSAFGMTGARNAAYITITVPATPAMPQVISANSSPRCIRAK